MEFSKRLQWVWKVNAYVILCAGLLTVIALLLLVFTLVSDKFQPRGVQRVVSTDEKDILQEQLFYSFRSSAQGVVVVDVTTNQRIETKFSSKDASNALRNQRFIKITGASQTQLFPNNNFLITRVYALSEKGEARLREYDEDEKTVHRIYEVVEKDTNGDKRLTENDSKHLMIAKSDGTQLMSLAQDVLTLDGAPIRTDEKQVHLVVTLANGVSKLLRFDLVTWKMLDSIQLPNLKDK